MTLFLPFVPPGRIPGLIPAMLIGLLFGINPRNNPGMCLCSHRRRTINFMSVFCMGSTGCVKGVLVLRSNLLHSQDLFVWENRFLQTCMIFYGSAADERWVNSIFINSSWIETWCHIKKILCCLTVQQPSCFSLREQVFTDMHDFPWVIYSYWWKMDEWLAVE